MDHFVEIIPGAIIAGLLMEEKVLVRVLEVQRPDLFHITIYGQTVMGELVCGEVNYDDTTRLRIVRRSRGRNTDQRAGSIVEDYSAITDRLDNLESQLARSEQINRRLRERIYSLEESVNQLQVTAFVRVVAAEYRLCGDHIDFITAKFADATCGPTGTYDTVESLEAAVRGAIQDYMIRLAGLADPSISDQLDV